MVFSGKDCQWYGRKPHKENVMKVWKDYTTEDAFFGIAKETNKHITTAKTKPSPRNISPGRNMYGQNW